MNLDDFQIDEDDIREGVSSETNETHELVPPNNSSQSLQDHSPRQITAKKQENTEKFWQPIEKKLVMTYFARYICMTSHSPGRMKFSNF